MFSSAGAYLWTSAFVIRKSSVTGGGPIVVTGFTNLTGGTSGAGPYAPMGVDNDNACATEGYFIGTDNAVYGLLQVRRVSTPGGTPTLSGNLSLTVPNTYFPNTQPAQGSTTNLDGNDDRLIKAALHTNKITGATTLWTVHGFRMTTACARTTTGSRNGERWYEITGSAPTAAAPLGGNMTLVQSGSLCDPATTNTKGYIYGSVIETGQGHMVLAATIAASNLYAGIVAAGRLRTDTLGATQATTTVQNGLNSYTRVANGRNRWGDYSFTDVDPNDDMTVWTFQEYADATANQWAVRAAQLKAPPPPPSTANPATVPQGATATTVVCSRTSGTLEFFDPGVESCGGPGWANHISATATNNVTVNSITFDSVSQVTLDLNTTASTPNTASVITIMNPDGQTAACNLTVGNPLAAVLADFSAAPNGNAIRVTWETVSEVGNIGFNLWRGDSPSAPDTQLNSALIPSQAPGSSQGFIYTFDDANVVSGMTYYYWLETVDTQGGVSRFGPVSAAFTAPTAVRVLDAGAAASLPLALPLAGAGLLALAGLALAGRRRG